MTPTAPTEPRAAASVVILFGKHAGAAIAELKTSYLQWLIRSVADLPSDVRLVIDVELAGRGAKRTHRVQMDGAVWRRLVADGVLGAS